MTPVERMRCEPRVRRTADVGFGPPRASNVRWRFVRESMSSVANPEPAERRVVEWLTTAAAGRTWQIEARKGAASADARDGPVYLLNYYAVRYGYDLVLAS